MNAVVVFCDNGPEGHPLLPYLKPGFRHCFCAVAEKKDYWLLVDAREGVPAVEYLTEASFNLAAFYRESGLTVIETRRGKSSRPT